MHIIANTVVISGAGVASAPFDISIIRTATFTVSGVFTLGALPGGCEIETAVDAGFLAWTPLMDESGTVITANASLWSRVFDVVGRAIRLKLTGTATGATFSIYAGGRPR